MSPDDLSQLSMLDLFRMEADTQAEVLTGGLLVLERDPSAGDQLELCMRAAHSLKGAARIVGLDAGVAIAHALEDCFVAAQAGTIVLGQAQIDRLLGGVELLMQVAKSHEHEVEQWEGVRKREIDACRASLQMVLEPNAAEHVTAAPAPGEPHLGQGAAQPAASDERVVRVTAESFNRLFGLASEALIKSRWVAPFTQSMTPLKRAHEEASRTLDRLRDQLPPAAGDQAHAALADLQRQLSACRQLVADRLVALEWFDRRAQHGLQRL